MNKFKNSRDGFSVIELLMVIVIIALITTVGWLLYKNHHKTTPLAANNTSTNTGATKQTPATFSPSVSLTAPTSYVSTSIPAVACDTGGPGVTADHIIKLSSETVNLPSSVSNVSYYYSTADSLGVVAPSGWSCDVLLAEDGSEGLAVSSDVSIASGIDGSGSYSPPKVTSSTNLQLIAISNTGACAGTCLDNTSTCAYFPSLLTEAESGGEPSFNCPKQPTGEIGSTLSSTLAYFGDPAGLKASGSYSGGVNPDIGILSYTPDNDNAQEYFGDCVLPTSEDNICNAAMTNFVIKNQSEL